MRTKKNKQTGETIPDEKIFHIYRMGDNKSEALKILIDITGKTASEIKAIIVEQRKKEMARDLEYRRLMMLHKAHNKYGRA